MELALSDHYTALGIQRLSSQEEAYVLNRVRGLNPLASARAAGYSRPARVVADFAERKDLDTAIIYLREMARQSILSGGADFSRDDATRLYLEAHAKSANATEEIKAVDSLVKLHGLAAPEKVEVQVTRQEQITALDDDALMELAGHDFHLSPDEYMVKDVSDGNATDAPDGGAASAPAVISPGSGPGS